MNPDTDPLAQLRDITLPDGVSWWPLAPGWWILLFLIVIAFWLLWRWLRYRKADRWRNEALLELETLRDLANHHQNNSLVLESTSALYRRLALLMEPRHEIASLTGQAWLEKLDSLSGNRFFTEGEGRILESAVWQKPEELQSLNTVPLLDSLENFIQVTVQRRKDQGRKIRAGQA